jgi:hypothetical protein
MGYSEESPIAPNLPNHDFFSNYNIALIFTPIKMNQESLETVNLNKTMFKPIKTNTAKFAKCYDNYLANLSLGSIQKLLGENFKYGKPQKIQKCNFG